MLHGMKPNTYIKISVILVHEIYWKWTIK